MLDVSHPDEAQTMSAYDRALEKSKNDPERKAGKRDCGSNPWYGEALAAYHAMDDEHQAMVEEIMSRDSADHELAMIGAVALVREQDSKAAEKARSEARGRAVAAGHWTDYYG